MQLSSHFTDRALRAVSRTFTWRDTTNYAAAVNDRNPLYFDDRREGGVIAPPLFCAAVTWPLTAAIQTLLPADDFPWAVLATQVHYSEHIRFLRPLVPDGVLTVSGRLAAILPHRAGTHVVIRYQATDAEGREIFCEHTGALLRGVECVGGGRGAATLPTLPEPGPAGPPVWQLPLFVDAMQPYIYDGCTGISFPIHTSPRFASQVGLPGIILQGTATLAMAVREIVAREADSDPLRLEALSCRFTGMVRPESEIVVRLLHRHHRAEGVDLHFDVTGPLGTVLKYGYARLKAPTADG